MQTKNVKLRILIILLVFVQLKTIFPVTYSRFSWSRIYFRPNADKMCRAQCDIPINCAIQILLL